MKVCQWLVRLFLVICQVGCTNCVDMTLYQRHACMHHRSVIYSHETWHLSGILELAAVANVFVDLFVQSIPRDLVWHDHCHEPMIIVMNWSTTVTRSEWGNICLYPNHFVLCACISSVVDSGVGKDVVGSVVASLLEEVLQGLFSQAGVHKTQQEYIYIYIYICRLGQNYRDTWHFCV